jgi:23S rRNA C2498 (ribose-2'-O)-methylase RlmM
MSKTSQAISVLTQAMIELARQQARVGTALTDVAREQRITNLIIRAQVTTDHQEKARLVAEAARRMDAPGWRAAPDPVWGARLPTATSHRP